MEVINRIKENIKKIIKDESGEAITPKEIIENEKKIITSAIILASINHAIPSIAQESHTKSMTPITAAMDVYRSDRWNQSIMTQYENILNAKNKDKYLYFGIALPGTLSNDTTSQIENMEILKYYDNKKVPSWIINGIVNDYKYDTSGIKLIPENIEITKQWAGFKLNTDENNKNCSFEINVLNDEFYKSKNKYALNIIVFQENVNCKPTDELQTTILNRVAKQYPLGALGDDIKFEKGKNLIKKFNLNIPPSIQNNCLILAYIYDKNTKEFVASAYAPITNSETTTFNVNNIPESTLSNLSDITKYTSLNEIAVNLANLPEFIDQTGLKKKTFKVENAQDLSALSFEFHYTETEAEIYDFLTASINPKLKDKIDLNFDLRTKRVDIKFKEPFNGTEELFNFYLKIKKETANGIKYGKGMSNSANCKVKNFVAKDINGNLIKYKITGEQKILSPARMVTKNNPYDLNEDDRIDEKDYNEFQFSWGSRSDEPEYDIQCDFNQDGSINFIDFVSLSREWNEQYELEKEIRSIDPKALPNTEDIPPIQLTGNQKLDNQKIRSWCDKFYARQSQLRAQ